MSRKNSKSKSPTDKMFESLITGDYDSMPRTRTPSPTDKMMKGVIDDVNTTLVKEMKKININQKSDFDSMLEKTNKKMREQRKELDKKIEEYKKSKKNLKKGGKRKTLKKNKRKTLKRVKKIKKNKKTFGGSKKNTQDKNKKKKLSELSTIGESTYNAALGLTGMNNKKTSFVSPPSTPKKTKSEVPTPSPLQTIGVSSPLSNIPPAKNDYPDKPWLMEDFSPLIKKRKK
jgi:hypothetical protein